MQIFVNGRFRSHRITGIQRYAHELTRRLSLPVFEPARKLTGWRGHAWEQTILPARTLHGLLWSPCAVGPLFSHKHIVTFHDLFPIDSPSWFKPSFVRAYRVLLTMLSKTATHLIAVSHFTKSRMVDRLGVAPSRITVVHNGIDLETFRSCPRQAAAARAALSLPPGRYLLCLGSLEPRKNLGRLLSAWSSVVASLPTDIHLVVSGFRDTAVFKAPDTVPIPDRVTFTGYVPDQHLAGLYSGSLAFIYPSLGEGFGLPPLEAMACGVPVFTSNVTSLPEVCGRAAIYGDPLKTSDIASAIKLLCSDPALRESLRRLGPRQAALFDWDRAAQATSSVLLRYAANKN